MRCRMKRRITLVLLLAPGTLFAQSAFDGTWRIDPHSMQYVGTEKYSLQNGVRVRRPTHLVVLAVGLYVDFGKARIASIYTILKRILFSPNVLHAVWVYTPGSVKRALCKQRAGRKEQHQRDTSLHTT